jgi:very-short-patch-repair endonuclease
MRQKSAKRDLEIAVIAARQHGVVSRRQLLAAGIADPAVYRRVERGRLHRVHRGVYAVGHRGLSLEGRWMAAVLACGDGAVLSHTSAAALWRLLDPRDGAVRVAVSSTNGRRRQIGIRLHRLGTLTAHQTTRKHGIPVTTPARTIADLRGGIPDAHLRRAIRQAEVLGLRTDIDASPPTRSELEEQFLRLCRRQRLPPPEVNARIGALEVDFLWRDPRLIVETDGYRYHRGVTAFEDDHARDLDLRAGGFSVLRFTYRQVTTEPSRVAGAVRREIQATRPQPSPQR